MADINLTAFEQEQLKTLSLTPFTCNCIAAFDYMIMIRVLAAIKKEYNTIAFNEINLTNNTDTISKLVINKLDICIGDVLVSCNDGIKRIVNSIVYSIQHRLGRILKHRHTISIVIDACKLDSINSAVYLVYIAASNNNTEDTNE